MPEPTHVCALCGVQLYSGTVMATGDRLYWFDLGGHGRCQIMSNGVFFRHAPADPPPVEREDLEAWLDS